MSYRQAKSGQVGYPPRSVKRIAAMVLAPVLCGVFVAGLYVALVRPRWEAVQALVVRDEASSYSRALANQVTRPGKFMQLDDMKATQETILELARSRPALTDALREATHSSELAASPEAIDELASAVKIAPPKGAEFGKTEIFYLKVRDPDPVLAAKLAEALSGQIIDRFESLRAQKASNVIKELEKTVSLAKSELRQSTATLAQLELQAGTDLAELRILNDSPSGDSDLRRRANELDHELRTFEAQQETQLELLGLLEAAKIDPGQLLASPSRLLESQPGLKRLKEGLVDAQLRTAQLLGSMDSNHPAVLASIAAEHQVGAHLHDELEIAVRGVGLDRRLAQQRLDALKAERSKMHERMMMLSGIRAEYANVLSAAKGRGELLKSAEQDLSEAEASFAAAHRASRVQRVQTPDVGGKPIDPSPSIVVLGGAAGGLCLGLAVLFVLYAPKPTLPTVATLAEAAGYPSRHVAGAGMSLRDALRKLAPQPAV